MKFGPVPLAEAVGAILAHSEPVAGGRLRKGQVLEGHHLDQLRAMGLRAVTVARLEPGDLHEDAAALRLARALAGGATGIRLGNPGTGRVNLMAEGPGVVRLDPGAIHAANAAEPMITVATVPDMHQIRARGMIATVKIISYAVPETALKAACAAAQGAIRLMPPVLHGASLIVTHTGASAGDKGVDAIAARLNALGMTLDEVIDVPHDIAAIATALGQGAGDLLLILTASATSDVRDTAPSALRQAGGQVIRFGMPVDPGNLLFLGHLGTRPVIGLPGSARSPVLHGADWVLARVACGIDVTAADIAAMGVGGLLKEIPTRPMPRRGVK